MRARNYPPYLHAIRGVLGCCFLLEDGDNSVMLDTGLAGEMFFIRRKVAQLGLTPHSIKTILLSHGHLDHAGNLAKIKLWTGARVMAHPLEQAHIDGAYPYQGINRWCGRAEALGRLAFKYQSAKIDEPLSDGLWLPLWGGLRVIHLPGHTQGHCGFFSEKHNLLFCGDMMATSFIAHRPPAILNSAPELLAASAEKIRQLKPRWIIPFHFRRLDGDLQRRCFVKVYGFKDWETVSS